MPGPLAHTPRGGPSAHAYAGAPLSGEDDDDGQSGADDFDDAYEVVVGGDEDIALAVLENVRAYVE